MASVKSVRRRLADGTVKTYTYDAARYDGSAGPPAAHASGLRTLAVDWQRSPEWAQLAASTRRSYRYCLGLIDDHLGHLRLTEIEDRATRADFYEFRDALAATPAMADVAVKVLNTLLSWAQERGRIDINRAAKIGRLTEDNTRAAIVLAAADEQRLMAAAAPELRHAIAMALLTGARMGDLIGLRRSLHVLPDGWLRFTPAKTRRRKIVVELPPAIVARASPGDVLVARADGRPWTPAALDWAWRCAAGAVGLDHLHFHDLRGTRAQRFYEASASDAEVAAVLGKAIGRGTMRAYAHASRDLVLNAYARLDRVISLPEKKTRKTAP